MQFHSVEKRSFGRTLSFQVKVPFFLFVGCPTSDKGQRGTRGLMSQEARIAPAPVDHGRHLARDRRDVADLAREPAVTRGGDDRDSTLVPA